MPETPEERQDRYFREQQAAEQRRFEQSQQAQRDQFYASQQQEWQMQQERMAWEREQARMQAERENRRWEEEKQLGAQQRAYERHQRAAGLEAQMTQARGRAGAQESALQGRFGEIDALRAFQEQGARREDALSRASMRNQITGQGLGLSGIREGAEARQTAGLLSKIGGLNLQAGMERDALTRQIAQIRAELAAQLAAGEAEKRAINEGAF